MAAITTSMAATVTRTTTIPSSSLPGWPSDAPPPDPPPLYRARDAWLHREPTGPERRSRGRHRACLLVLSRDGGQEHLPDLSPPRRATAGISRRAAQGIP